MSTLTTYLSRSEPPSPRERRLLPILVTLIVLLVPAIAAAIAPPAPLAGTFLSGETTAGPAPGNQQQPAIARGGDQYLAVWTDSRSSFDDATEQSSTRKDIYAARLDADGNVIDVTPIVVTDAPGDQYDPQVSWNGNKWLVVWTGTESSNQYIHNIQGARISADGQLLDTTPLQLWVNDFSSEHLFGLASDGQNWAIGVVDEYYDGLATKTRLVARRILDSGSVTAVSGVFSPSSGVFFGREGLTWTGTNYLAVVYGYVDSFYFGIMGIRLTSTLTVLDSYPFPITETMWSNNDFYVTPGVGSSGNGLFIAWEFQHDNGTSELYGARVDVDGNSIDGNGFEIAGGLPSSFDAVPQVTWDGNQWIVGWPQDGAFHMTRISGLGGVAPPVIPVTAAGDGAIAGTGAGTTQYVWPENRFGGTLPLDLFTARLDGVLMPGTDQTVALSAPFQTEAALATAPDGYLLVYRSMTSDQTRIMARPLDEAGMPLASEPVMVASGAVSTPRAGYSEGTYLVTWTDGSATVKARRLAADGTPLDPSPLTVMSGHDADVAGYAGGDPAGIFLVTAQIGAGTVAQTSAVRVAGDGSVLDTTPVMLAPDHALYPRVIQHGDNWLAVWEATGHGNGGEIDGALVTTTGAAVGFHFTSDTDGIVHHRPALAGSDTTVVIWEDPREGGSIYGRRLLPGLDSFDPAGGIPIIDAANSAQDEGEVGFDGSTFLVVARDDRSATSSDPRTDVYRNWVRPLDFVADTDGIPLYTTAQEEREPAVAGGAGYAGGAVYAATVFDPAAPHAAYRIEVSPTTGPTEVAQGETPPSSRLLSVYPNPANPAVEIRYRASASGDVAIDVYDVRGQRVRTLHARAQGAGEGQVRWDGTDADGRTLASGTYLLRLRGASEASTGRVVLVR